MKNMIKYVLIFVVGALVMSSCEDLETNYASMTKDFDKSNTTYYIQYLNASQYFETAIDEAGLPTDIVTTVGVALQGAPQSSDVVVSIVVAPESPLQTLQYLTHHHWRRRVVTDQLVRALGPDLLEIR